MGGEEAHALTTGELATHNHLWGYWACLGTILGNSYSWASLPGGGTNGIWCKSNNQGTTNSGSNTSHNTMQPYTGINFIIYTGVE
jgi:microcystin-dependent protein